MTNSVVTIKNRSASPVVLSTAIPTPVELTVPANDSITVSVPDNYLNPLIVQCEKRGIAYNIWSD
jgi:hypothetical protein